MARVFLYMSSLHQRSYLQFKSYLDREGVRVDHIVDVCQDYIGLVPNDLSVIPCLSICRDDGLEIARFEPRLDGSIDINLAKSMIASANEVEPPSKPKSLDELLKEAFESANTLEEKVNIIARKLGFTD